jgi:hypothetical protein
LGSRISGSSSSISSSTCGVDKITSSQPSSKVSKAGMSLITVYSSTSIPVVLTRWNIFSWSYSGSVASSFRPVFRK